jgi:hypothetical protein
MGDVRFVVHYSVHPLDVYVEFVLQHTSRPDTGRYRVRPNADSPAFEILGETNAAPMSAHPIRMVERTGERDGQPHEGHARFPCDEACGWCELADVEFEVPDHAAIGCDHQLDVDELQRNSLGSYLAILDGFGCPYASSHLSDMPLGVTAWACRSANCLACSLDTNTARA